MVNKSNQVIIFDEISFCFFFLIKIAHKRKNSKFYKVQLISYLWQKFLFC